MLTRLHRSQVSPVRFASPLVMVALVAGRVSQTQKTRSPTWRGPSIVSTKRATLNTPSRRQRQHTASSGTGLPETTAVEVRGSAMAYGRPHSRLRPRHTLCVRRRRTRLHARLCSTARMQIVESADGTRIAYEAIGDGIPVVIVGGAFSTSAA